MTQMTLEQRLYDGTRAREVLENEQFIQAFESIEKEIIEQWKTAPARDAEGRERLWTYLSLLSKLKACLTQTLETGKLAQKELEHQQKLMDRLKAGWGSLTA